MFSWLGYGQGPEKEQKENISENVPENAKETSSETVEKMDNNGGDTKQEKDSSDSTQSELDYAKDMAKNVGSFLFSMASAASSTALKVKDTMEHKSILGDFTKEQEKFIKEKHKRKEAAVAPWVGYNEEEAMKSQILALSTDERNFLRDPPSGVQFYYEHDNMFPVALATLEEDENLQKMRFSLVPKKVKEERFWRNYFYRVSLIKQSTQLTSLAASGSEKMATQAETTEGKAEIQDSTPTPPQAIPTDANNDKHGTIDVLPDSPTQHEFISDDFVHHDTLHELSREDLQQIGMDRKEQPPDTNSAKSSTTKPIDLDPPPEEDIPDWEKELQQELQDYEVVDEDNGEWEKEIEDMLEAES